MHPQISLSRSNQGEIKEDEVGGACGTHWRGEKTVQDFVGKPKVKRQLDRLKCRWEGGIKMDLREIDLGGGGVELFRVGTGGGLL
jgi:hypothetical protein